MICKAAIPVPLTPAKTMRTFPASGSGVQLLLYRRLHALKAEQGRWWLTNQADLC